MLLLLITVAALAVWFYLKVRKAEARIAGLSMERDKANTAAAEAQARVVLLARYEAIVDAEAHATALVDDARASADALVRGAESRAAALTYDAHKIANGLKQDAEAQSTALIESSRAAARAHKLDAERLLAETHKKEREIVDAANQRAVAIAGDAYKALEEAKETERALRAMKNVIEGYGDKYLIPVTNLLDELGEEIGFTEAGQRLKVARDRVRDMVRHGRAAACDYAEPNRKETAIRFVLDAFNGKAESILADVRHDNYGTLKQKLQDAYGLVNHNGEAFRNARILSSYFDARIDELKWAVAAQEFKQREREEQRALKEQIREEERAQREFDKAMKEAAKEEDTLRKAMEKARREVESATDAQRAKYEAKLAELSDRLRAAEEKNQRALSMAQQTKAGHVYVISNVGSFGEQVYKIGLTRRLEPLDRIKELGDASVPFEFDVHALIRSDDAPALERSLHKRFVRQQVNKVNPRKEFFRVSLDEVRQVAEEIGCRTTWTMAAECRQHKESLAIEKQMATQAGEGVKWVEQQLKEIDLIAQEPVNDVVEMAS
jgi:hypothetical protein